MQNGNEPRKHTIAVLVENKFGVLSRVAGLFSARGYNIESLSVGETLDPSRVPLESAQFLAGGGVPQFDRSVTAGRRQPSPVRTECHAIDPIRVPLEGEDHFLPRQVPHCHGVAGGAARQTAAAGVDGQAPDVARADVEAQKLLPLLGIPDPDGAVTARRGE